MSIEEFPFGYFNEFQIKNVNKNFKTSIFS